MRRAAHSSRASSCRRPDSWERLQANKWVQKVNDVQIHVHFSVFGSGEGRSSCSAAVISPRESFCLCDVASSICLHRSIINSTHGLISFPSLPGAAATSKQARWLALLARRGRGARTKTQSHFEFCFLFSFHQGEGLLHVLCPGLISIAALQRCKDVT